MRLLVLTFFSIIGSRLLSEVTMCKYVRPDVVLKCGPGLVIIVLFFVSVYFIDNLIVEYYEHENKKDIFYTLIFTIPYFGLIGFVISRFISTLTAVSIEYILSVGLFYSGLIFTAFYNLNSYSLVRRVNKVFMVTLILSILLFIVL